MKKVVWLLLALFAHGSAQAEGDAEAGQALFTKYCGGCHKIGPNAQAAFGPQLTGIIGRPAGHTTDYKYSSEMLNSGIVWDREKLSAFIKEPSDVVDGTKMRFWGISDKQKIEDLLAYLALFP
jgi:cytochrome c